MKHRIVGGRTIGTLSGIAVALAIVLAGVPVSAQDPGVVGVMAGTTSAGAGTLLVYGTQTTFLPRGFVSESLSYPTQYDTALCTEAGNKPGNSQGKVLLAAQAAMTAPPLPGLGYNASLQAMVNDWGANTVRFNLSQGGLVYEYKNGLTAYTDMVRNTIAQARAADLVVILVMQTEIYSCSPLENGALQKLPDVNTEEAWAQLLDSTITSDNGVVLEVFNEADTEDQCDTGTKTNWQDWAYGCPAGNAGAEPGQGFVTVGNYLRSVAPNNLLIFDGENEAGLFDTSEPYSVLPTNSALAVHPFAYSYPLSGTGVVSTSETNWYTRWGFLLTANSENASPEAVVATAWNESSNCPTDPGNAVTDYLVQTYLPSNNIGLLVYSWDAPAANAGYLVNSYNSGSDPNYNYAPVDYKTTPSNTSCSPTDGALLVQQQFLQEAGRGVELITRAVLSEVAGGGYQATVTITNNGTGTTQNVQLTAATLGSAAGTQLPIYLGNIAPGGGSASTTVTFPSSAGAPGTSAAERYTGSYNGGTFGGSIRATLP